MMPYSLPAAVTIPFTTVALAIALPLAPLAAQSAPPNFLEEFEGQFGASASKLVALARANPDAESELFLKQLERDSWYDEIRIAALQAMGELERDEFLPALRAHADGRYNQDVRRAALSAWVATAPTDHALHVELTAVARASVYSLQKFAVEQLGEQYVFEAGPQLEELAKQDIDIDLTVRAREALEEIERITGRPVSPEVPRPTPEEGQGSATQ